MKYHRISVNPQPMGGMPCIRDIRIPGAAVLGTIVDGMKEDEIPEAYPDLERADTRDALIYAAGGDHR